MNRATRSKLPALRPPLSPTWTWTAGDAVVLTTPVSDGGQRIAVAAGDRVTCLSASDGSERWQQRVQPGVSEIIAVTGGVLVASGDLEDTELVAWSWDGELLWRQPTGISSGDGRLGADASLVYVVGVRLSGTEGPVCQLRDASTGQLVRELAGVGGLPSATSYGLVWSSLSDDPAEAGLFRTDPTDGATTRISELSHSVRVVAEGPDGRAGLTVVDTFAHGLRQSRLTALDLESGSVLWEEPGGGPVRLAVDTGQLACAQALDHDRLAVTLRDLGSGRALWTADPVTADSTALLLSADCVLSFVDGDHLDVYDRSTGELVQTLAEDSSLAYGGCLTPTGLVDAFLDEVRARTGAPT